MNVIHNVRRYHRRVSALRAGELVIRRKRHSTGGILPHGVPGLQMEPTQRAVRAAEARVALSTGQLRPQLQPIVAVPSGALEGFELLARWRRPGGEMVPPTRFLPLLRKLGLSGEFDLSMVKAATNYAQIIREETGDGTSLHVNLSPVTLNDAAAMAPVLAHLEQAAAVREFIVVEVTEESSLGAGGTQSIIALRDLGIRVAIDDFGEGHSSLARFLEMQIDIVKLDRHILNICRSHAGSGMLARIVWMLQARSVQVVLEGIEDRHDWELAVMSGCNSAQGFAIARPMEWDAALALARRSDHWVGTGQAVTTEALRDQSGSLPE